MEVLQKSTGKDLTSLVRHLAHGKRFDEAEINLARLAMQTVMPMINSIQPRQIALQSRGVLERHNAVMSSQYLCGTPRPEKSHIIHEVSIGGEIGVSNRAG